MRINPRYTVIFHDLLMSALAWELAWLARYNFTFPGAAYWEAHLKTLAIVVLPQGAITGRLGLYRGLWRFASLQDLWNILRAAGLGTLCVIILLFVVTRL